MTRVSRCVCFDVTIAEIVARVRAGESLVEVHKDTGCGGRCGLCVPYLRYALKTGDSLPPVMWTADFEAHGIPPGAIARLEKWLSQQEARA